MCYHTLSLSSGPSRELDWLWSAVCLKAKPQILQGSLRKKFKPLKYKIAMCRHTSLFYFQNWKLCQKKKKKKHLVKLQSCKLASCGQTSAWADLIAGLGTNTPELQTLKHWLNLMVMSRLAEINGAFHYSKVCVCVYTGSSFSFLISWWVNELFIRILQITKQNFKKYFSTSTISLKFFLLR